MKKQRQAGATPKIRILCRTRKSPPRLQEVERDLHHERFGRPNPGMSLRPGR